MWCWSNLYLALPHPPVPPHLTCALQKEMRLIGSSLGMKLAVVATALALATQIAISVTNLSVWPGDNLWSTP